MNIFSRMRAAVRTLFKSDDLPAPAGWRELTALSSYGFSGQLEVPPTPEQLLREYERSIWVYDCVSVKARFVASLPVILKRRRKGDDEVVREHEALDLLNRPAVGQTWIDLCESVDSYLSLCGRAFIEVVRDGNDVRELHPMLPHRMRVLVDAERGITGYVYTPNVREIHLEPDEIVYVKSWDPLSEHGSVGAMSSAWLSNLMDRHARRWNAQFFLNGAHPDVILKSDKALPPALRERLEREFLKRHQGTMQGRRVEVLEHGLTFEETGISHREMQFRDLARMTRQEIHAAWHVPPVLSGLTDETNYATSSIQLRIFRDHVAIPELGKILESIGESILPGFRDGKDLYYAIDVEATALPEERQALWTETVQAMSAGLITKDEARARVGYPPAILESEPKPKPELVPMSEPELASEEIG